MHIKFSPSLLSADFSRLEEEVKKVESAGAQYLHWDIMDGHFVPNLTFGPACVKSLRNKSSLVFDVHLMILNPGQFLQNFIDSGADIITFHLEAVSDPTPLIEQIKSAKKKVGLAINPDTPLSRLLPFIKNIDMAIIMTVFPGFGGQKFIPDVLPKIRQLREIIDEDNLDVELEVDGGVNLETIESVVEAGGNVLVAGSAIFGQKNPVEALKNLRNKAISVVRKKWLSS